MHVVPSSPAPKASRRYPLSLRMDAVRLVSELRGACVSRREAITMVVDRIGCRRQTLINWVRAAERRARSPAAAPAGQRRLEALEREVRELRRANAALRRIVEGACGRPS
ncbi:MAG: transposase [Pseudomonas sp.]